MKRVIHVSMDQAAVKFRSLIEEVRKGATVVIEHESRAVGILETPEPVRRSVSECVAIARAHERETGTAPVLDADFAEDLEAILRRRHTALRNFRW